MENVLERVLRISRPPASRRVEIQELYRRYMSGMTMSVTTILQFLHIEQMELTANEETAVELIEKYEIVQSAKESRTMTFEGFLRYMESRDCCVFNPAHSLVYQNMEQPLSSYFISSSHNTYLVGDQIVGQSHLDAYVCALRKGCRCLEIDCWDGPDKEPLVYHGYTLTTRILFKEVIAIVEQYAFESSPYPVILSLENHCCNEQQEIMANYLISILGEKLLRAPIDPNTEQLPSPNELKYKILIKNKKLKPRAEAAANVDEGEDEEEEEEEEEEDEEKRRFFPPRKKGAKKTKKEVVVVAKALSDLVVYTRSVKFFSFIHSRDNQHYNEITSFNETKARKLLKSSGADFIRHNQRFLSRIYPAGSRTSSSNYKPQRFWNVGCQLVALNYQSLATPMDLNNGRFLDNGRCGYILKPALLMSSQGDFDPRGSQAGVQPIDLTIKVISGSNLPILRHRSVLDPFVKVAVYGIPSDSAKKKTQLIRNNSLNPRWEAVMNFKISRPELCLIRFSLRDQTGLISNEFVGQYTLPFTSLMKGYRWVPLWSQDGCSLDPASLFVFVSYT